MSDILLCPVCGSGKVGPTKGIGYDVVCQFCGWVGKEQEAVAKPLQIGQAETIASAVSISLMRQLVTDSALTIGAAILKSELIVKSDRTSLARLIRTAVNAAHRAILDEVDKMQQEIKNGNAS